jgi:hypothetical protein
MILLIHISSNSLVTSMNKLFENEQMFEKGNTRMAKATASLTPADFPEDFVLELYCECANKVCQERISVAYDEY